MEVIDMISETTHRQRHEYHIAVIKLHFSKEHMLKVAHYCIM